MKIFAQPSKFFLGVFLLLAGSCGSSAFAGAGFPERALGESEQCAEIRWMYELLKQQPPVLHREICSESFHANSAPWWLCLEAAGQEPSEISVRAERALRDFGCASN